MITSSNNHPEKEFQRHADKVAALRLGVLLSSGTTEPVTRHSAFSGEQLPASLHEYVTKIRGTASYRITDEDLNNLLAAGFSQDAIFEITIAAALGAATERLESGLAALKEAD